MKDIWPNKKDKQKYLRKLKRKYWIRYNYWIRGFVIEEKQAQIAPCLPIDNNI